MRLEMVPGQACQAATSGWARLSQGVDRSPSLTIEALIHVVRDHDKNPRVVDHM